MGHFSISRIDGADLALAWPLARAAAPSATLDGWRDAVRRLMARGGGVIAASAEDGCFHGLATYEPVVKLRAGRVLQVELLAAFELSRRSPVRRALLEGLERIARSSGCQAISVPVPSRGHVKHHAGALLD